VVSCGNQFELVGSAIYLAFANSCPTDIHGKTRKTDGQWPRGITLYTSVDFGKSFEQACLPVALKVGGEAGVRVQGVHAAERLLLLHLRLRLRPGPLMMRAGDRGVMGPGWRCHGSAGL
jgi:hypothetical protein